MGALMLHLEGVSSAVTVSDLESGIYILELTSEGQEVFRTRFMVH